jgi:hypothetical protein
MLFAFVHPTQERVATVLLPLLTFDLAPIANELDASADSDDKAETELGADGFCAILVLPPCV